MVRLKLWKREKRHSCSKRSERTSSSLSFSWGASSWITSCFSHLDPCPLRLFAFFFAWPASLPQQALEELAVLVEMVDGIVVVGARALHELVKVARRVLLGLSAHVIHRGDQRGVGRSVAILSVLFPPLHGGALVLILALGLTFAVASVGAR